MERIIAFLMHNYVIVIIVIGLIYSMFFHKSPLERPPEHRPGNRPLDSGRPGQRPNRPVGRMPDFGGSPVFPPKPHRTDAPAEQRPQPVEHREPRPEYMGQQSVERREPRPAYTGDPAERREPFPEPAGPLTVEGGRRSQPAYTGHQVDQGESRPVYPARPVEQRRPEYAGRSTEMASGNPNRSAWSERTASGSVPDPSAPLRGGSETEASRSHAAGRLQTTPMMPSVAAADEDTYAAISRDELTRAIVWAEILGPPRSRRPYRK